MSKVIESDVVMLEDTGAKPDYISEEKAKEKKLVMSFNELSDYIKVRVDNNKREILVCKYRLNLENDLDEVSEILNFGLSERSIDRHEQREYISKIRWNEALLINIKLGGFTLTPRYFIDFLRTLDSGFVRDGNNRIISNTEAKKIYDEIAYREKYSLGEELYGEWLDASFNDVSNNHFTMSYNHKLKEDILIPEDSVEIRHQGTKEGTYLRLVETGPHGIPTKMYKPGEIGEGEFFYNPPGEVDEPQFSKFVNYGNTDLVGFFHSAKGSESKLGLGVRHAKLIK